MSLAVSTDPGVMFSRWLENRAWDHFTTFTFDLPTSTDSARRYFENTFVRHLERRSQLRVEYFGAIEQAPATGRVHVHAVLAGTAGLRTSDVVDAWIRGHAAVSRFDPKRGGLAYVAKSLGEPDSQLLLRDHRVHGIASHLD